MTLDAESSRSSLQSASQVNNQPVSSGRTATLSGTTALSRDYSRRFFSFHFHERRLTTAQLHGWQNADRGFTMRTSI